MVTWMLMGLFFLMCTAYTVSDGDLSMITLDDKNIHKFMLFMILGPISIIPAGLAVKEHYSDNE